MKNRERLYFYESMIALLDSGAGLSQALKLIKSKSSSLRSFADQAYNKTIKGGSLTSICKDFPDEEQVLIKVGEESGELIEIFRFLLEKLQREAELVRFMISKMWQPAFLFIFALFLFPSINYLIGKKSYSLWFISTALPLGIVSIAIFVLIYKWVMDPLFRKKSLIKLLSTPYIGKTILLYESYKFFWTYYIFVRAGIEVGTALSSMKEILFTPKRLKALAIAQENKMAGHEIHSGLKLVFPDNLVERWEIAFHAGKEEQMLETISDEIATDFKRRMDMISRWIPKIIYAIVVIFVFYKLWSFFQYRFEEIDMIDQY